MNILYSPEQDKNSWDYNSDVGIIPKSSEGTDYDAKQDQNIESNKQQIVETREELRENEAKDEQQQSQLDANDAVDRQQQEEIDNNTEKIASNEQLDQYQQSQIDDTIARLNENISEDTRQQQEIDTNKENISRVEGELPTLEMQGTTLVIGKRGDL